MQQPILTPQRSITFEKVNEKDGEIIIRVSGMYRPKTPSQLYFIGRKLIEKKILEQFASHLSTYWHHWSKKDNVFYINTNV